MRAGLAASILAAATAAFAGGCAGEPETAPAWAVAPAPSYSTGLLDASDRMSFEVGTALHHFSGVYGLHLETSVKVTPKVAITLGFDSEKDANPDVADRNSDWDLDITALGLGAELIPAGDDGLGGFVLALSLLSVQMDANDDDDVTEGQRVWLEVRAGYRLVSGHFIVHVAGRAAGGMALEVTDADDPEERLQHILDLSSELSVGVAF